MRWLAAVFVVCACSMPPRAERLVPDDPSEEQAAASSVQAREGETREVETPPEPANPSAPPTPAEDAERTAAAPAVAVASSPGALAGHPSLLLRTIGSSRGLVYARGAHHTVIAREDEAGVTVCRKPAALGCERLEGAVLVPRLPDSGGSVVLVPVRLQGQARVVVAPRSGECWVLEDRREELRSAALVPATQMPDVETHNRELRAEGRFWSQIDQGPGSSAPRLTSTDSPGWVRPFYRRALEGFEAGMIARDGARRLVVVRREKHEPYEPLRVTTRVVARDAGGLWRTTPGLPGTVRSGGFADDWEPGAVFVAYEPQDEDVDGSSLGMLYGKSFRLVALRATDASLEPGGALEIGGSFFVRDTGTRSRVWRWWNDVRITAPREIELQRAYAYSADFDRRTGELSNEGPFTEIRGYHDSVDRPGPTGVYAWVPGRFVRKATD